MWAQTTRWLSRGTEGALRVRIRDEAGGPQLELDTDTPEGSFLRYDSVKATVRGPEGRESELTLEPIAPGRYAAPMPVTATGAYGVAVTAHDNQSSAEARVVRAVYWSADREARLRGADLPFLSRLASQTGGRVLGDGESPFSMPRSPGYVDVSRWLMVAALAMFLVDLFGGGRLPRAKQEKERRGEIVL